MNITETLESAHITSDSKARRVLNTAPNKDAGITLAEIEQGVTIERLETLQVPVYQYSTQITIHGTFRDIPDDLRVCGYKSVILNGNGSLGVRYVAIDGAKKKLLEHIARLADDSYWNVNIDSQGCEVYKIFHSQDADNDKKRTIECYKNTPDTLYIGGKRAVGLMYGGYAVVLSIGAIYDKNLWLLIKELTGISSQVEADKIASDKKIQRELDNIKWETEHKIERERIAKIEADLMSQIEPLYNWTVNPELGVFYSLSFYDGQPQYTKVEFKKRGNQLLRRCAFRSETFDGAKSSMIHDNFKFCNRKEGKEHRYITDIKETVRTS